MCEIKKIDFLTNKGELGMKILFETERLYLREILPTDAESMFEMDSDAEVYKFLGRKPIRNINESKKMIESIRDQYERIGIGRWAIVEKESGNFIGWTGFKFEKENQNGHSDFYNLKFRLLRKYWGKGYITEATKAAIHYAFTELKIPEIYSMTLLSNLKSQRVLNKLGFQLEDKFKFQGDDITWYKLTNK
ncbi:GNAT family N-acetyltransferase [Labilibaculum sp. A4]|uniref:GNAT family N-acetyltransferase n=1 Tax=Labilibaculum euxinus TaxID=2686357 RepID=UPI000F6283E7|nr:GNAT family N-acetyltransferase [Labilibaculum euxinus]MDQ1769980.1 GNAT family N-acetyltransferase [Labilibaculum euxinus]MWN77402.1 GNAT family N-acetyltransferase [Labilibaculum euxinus]